MGVRRGGGRGARLLERLLFSVMGPPQLGDLSAPVREPAARPVATCSRCGAPRDSHEVVRTPTLTYSRCPGGEG